ncbi:MAG: VTT domain-containing protein [Verrucomicrobia bacterium]|nr:VTT domain-containing protein [Verrucomicrobiota bacterium]
MLNWIKHHKLKLVIAILLIGVCSVVAVTYLTDWELADLKDWISYWTDEIRTWPAILFFLIVVLLPLVGFPISPLFIIAGIRFGVTLAIPFSMAALTVNLIIAYWISTKLLHRLIQRIARRWNYSIPKASQKNASRWVFVVRISGAPLAVQNYILGIAHVPFWPYLYVSLAVQSVFVVGTIIFGESFVSGNMGKALLGLGLLVVAFLAVSYFRKRYAQAKPGPADTAGG